MLSTWFFADSSCLRWPLEPFLTLGGCGISGEKRTKGLNNRDFSPERVCLFQKKIARTEVLIIILYTFAM